MPRKISFEIDEDSYTRYERVATHLGITVPELIRSQLGLDEPRLSMETWLERTRNKPGSDVTREEVLAATNQQRGPWPESSDPT
jgi:hypothetical protein